MEGVTIDELLHLAAYGLELAGMATVCLAALLLPLAFAGRLLGLIPPRRDNG
jgi:hypothetical protein